VFDCLFSPRDGSVRLAANGPITEGNSLLFLIYSCSPVLLNLTTPRDKL